MGYLQKLMANMRLVWLKPDTSCPSCCAECFMKILQSTKVADGTLAGLGPMQRGALCKYLMLQSEAE